MASSWPGALDYWPTHVDNTEYMTAADLNLVQIVIQQMETIIGYGTGSNPLNPLYSPTYNASFSTITARLGNVEAEAAAAFPLDHAPSDIQPTGSTAAAGSTGKAADAGHVHPGQKTYRLPQAYVVGGVISVPSGASGYLPPFFMPVAGGQTVKFKGIRYVIRAGTSVTFNIQQNGSNVSGYTGLNATSTAGSTISGTTTVNDGDAFAPLVTAVTGNPDSLSISLYFDITQ